MKRKLPSFAALAVLALAAHTRAETLTALVALSPANEVPPIVGLNATGNALVTITVNRDTSGAITGGAVKFLVQVRFPGSVTVTGLHIHEGAVGAIGGVVFDAGLSGTDSQTLANGSGTIELTVVNANAGALQRLLQNPARFYVNLRTSVYTSGAMRGQLARLSERAACTLMLSPAEVVPPTAGLNASGLATITANPTRDARGAINSGSVTFTVTYDFSGSVTITGLYIHEAPAGMNGSVVIGTNLSATNAVTSPNGKGTLSLAAPLNTADAAGALQRLLDNPAGFYVNLRTSANPGGALRGQLAALAVPPALTAASSYLLLTNTANSTLMLDGTGLDANSIVFVNGQMAATTLDPATGQLSVMIPPDLLGSEGALYVQVRDAQGLLSAPIVIAVAAQTNINTQATNTASAASFTAPVAADSIASAFGTKLASQTVSATTLPLPTTLDGTTVYVNGMAAPLFFVSPAQINCLIPPDTLPGNARVVVVAKDGTVSQGGVVIAATAPGIFTRRANGQGAPAAAASADGVNFTVSMSNADGTPAAVDAGSYVALFGTGFRVNSGAVSLTIGNSVNIPALYAGAQGGFAGLDQLNFQIPASLAGRGEQELTVTVDGRTTNVVRVKLK